MSNPVKINTDSIYVLCFVFYVLFQRKQSNSSSQKVGGIYKLT